MTCGCQEVEVYDYLSNSTIVLDVCSNAVLCNYLATGFVTIVVFMMFLLCCAISSDLRGRKRTQIGYVRMEAGGTDNQPPQYNSL